MDCRSLGALSRSRDVGGDPTCSRVLHLHELTAGGADIAAGNGPGKRIFFGELRMRAVGGALLLPAFSQHQTNGILHKNLLITRFIMDDSAPINSFVSPLEGIAAEWNRPKLDQLLTQFHKQV